MDFTMKKKQTGTMFLIIFSYFITRRIRKNKGNIAVDDYACATEFHSTCGGKMLYFNRNIDCINILCKIYFIIAN